jgi:hypothetical protein
MARELENEAEFIQLADACDFLEHYHIEHTDDKVTRFRGKLKGYSVCADIYVMSDPAEKQAFAQFAATRGLPPPRRHKIHDLLLSGKNSSQAFRIAVLSKLDVIQKAVMALADQLTQLQAAVADVKQSATDEAARVDKIITALQPAAADNPVVAQAIADLQSTSATLKAFHAG